MDYGKMIAITVRIFWGFGKLALLLRSIYLEHLEGLRPPPEPTQKSHFFKAPSPPPLPATAHAGKTSWVKWWAVG